MSNEPLQHGGRPMTLAEIAADEARTAGHAGFDLDHIFCRAGRPKLRY